MIPDCAYFVKVNVALVLFYAIYRLLFYEDTFFKLRRVVLLLFFGVSLLYPFLGMQDWMQGQVSITKIAEVSGLLKKLSKFFDSLRLLTNRYN